ncbi:MAG: zinc ABC transporter substrate-binding protein, partial [Parachlamydiales bacterium]
KNRTILASHRAFTYFCAEYGLKQLSVENENKEPDLKTLYHLLNQVKKENVKKIFIQAQVDNKGAQFIGQELELPLFLVDPYSAHYLENLQTIARIIAE